MDPQPLRASEMLARAARRAAYSAGYDCGVRGPNVNNYHFATPEHTALWEDGKRTGEAARG